MYLDIISYIFYVYTFRISFSSSIEITLSINVPLIKERVENERRETREIS